MCGICGIFEPGRDAAIDPTRIIAMADTLYHRGPDDEGCYTAPGIGLGFRRLSIIDLQDGHQPLSNEDGTIWIAFNGEIYNFEELNRRYLSSGHRFKTRSDTETIVHLYEELGEECFAHLRGMFAIALWDGRRKRLVLARDRIGKKPLFYSWDGRRLVFGSEIKALWPAGGISKVRVVRLPTADGNGRDFDRTPPPHGDDAAANDAELLVVEFDDRGFDVGRRDRCLKGRLNLMHEGSSKTWRLAGVASFEQPMPQSETVKFYSVPFVTTVAGIGRPRRRFT